MLAAGAYGPCGEGPHSEAPVCSAGVARSVADRAVGVDERPERDRGPHRLLHGRCRTIRPALLRRRDRAHPPDHDPAVRLHSTCWSASHHQIRSALFDAVLDAAREGLTRTELHVRDDAVVVAVVDRPQVELFEVAPSQYSTSASAF
jgi:hypothetical protein